VTSSYLAIICTTCKCYCLKKAGMCFSTLVGKYRHILVTNVAIINNNLYFS